MEDLRGPEEEQHVALTPNPGEVRPTPIVEENSLTLESKPM